VSLRDNWRRVSRVRPCAICERPDWCLLSADGSTAICARVESPKRCGEAGWLHRLRDDSWQPARGVVRHIRIKSGAAPRADLARLAAQYREAVDHDRLHQLAISLGLSQASLCHLRIGWSAEHQAWSFPMTDAEGNVLGIRLRRPNGFKFSVTGGKEGLFISPSGEMEDSHLLICEGPTDTAALLDMGFVNVVGRPSCNGGVKLLVELVGRRRPPEVVVVADGDELGRRGADSLASVLVAYAPAVRVISPPDGIKDVREWLAAGATWPVVEQAIEAASVRRLKVQAVTGTERKHNS
jgi:hypothetical protein